MRRLVAAHEGCTVEELCAHLHVTHNAVRQHLSALMARQYVEHASSRQSGGRPLASYRLTEEGRTLFPRNYAVIATALVGELRQRMRDEDVEGILQAMGASLGSHALSAAERDTDEHATQALAKHMDAMGYEALAVPRGDELHIEAYNCVFHAMAAAHPQVCKFDIAYMQAATQRRVHHMECMVRGGTCCRFRVGPAKT